MEICHILNSQKNSLHSMLIGFSVLSKIIRLLLNIDYWFSISISDYCLINDIVD